MVNHCHEMNIGILVMFKKEMSFHFLCVLSSGNRLSIGVLNRISPFEREWQHCSVDWSSKWPLSRYMYISFCPLDNWVVLQTEYRCRSCFPYEKNEIHSVWYFWHPFHSWLHFYLKSPLALAKQLFLIKCQLCITY